MDETPQAETSDRSERPGKTRTLWHPLLARLLDYMLQYFQRVEGFGEVRAMEHMLSDDLRTMQAIKEDIITALLERVPTERKLRGVPPEDRLRGVPPEERLRGVPAQERVRGLTLEERLAGLGEEEKKQLRELLEQERHDELSN